MAEINDLSTTDASNTARFPEGMNPSAVNNAARALEGILARWDKDTNGSIATGGSSSDYTVSANRTISAYYDGLTIVAELNHTNDDTAVTLNVDSVGAGTVLQTDGTAPPVGTLVSGGKYIFVYDGTNFLVIRTPLIDEDNMTSDSVTAAPTQQSVKAYADWTYETLNTTTGGASVAFSSLPAGITEIDVFVLGASLSGTDEIEIQVGDSGGLHTSGYTGAIVTGAGGTAAAISSGFTLVLSGVAAATYHSVARLRLVNSATNLWMSDSICSSTNNAGSNASVGRVALDTALDRLSVKSSGSDTFDANAGIQIRYR